MGLGLEDAFKRAVDFEQAHRLDDAEQQCRRILGIEPGHAHAHHLLGLIAVRRKDLAAAVAHVQAALAVAPQTPPFLRTLAEIERRRHRFPAALALARQALALAPADAIAHTTEGVVLRDLRQLEDAVACQRRALAIAPDYAEAHLELAECLLLQGHFTEAWNDLEWHFRIAGAPPLMPPMEATPWDGRKLGGTLLLIADQGFGDAIQFARYIPWARTRCRHLALAVSPELRPLMADNFPGITHFTMWHEQPPFDAFAALSSLPRLHGTTLATIPAPIPYLRADPALAAEWKQRLDAVTPPGRRRVGIAWAGRPSHANDGNRSAPVELFARVAAQDVLLVSLQRGTAGEAVTALRGGMLLDLGEALTDFRTTAAILANLDLVIAVDTSIVHLAGAMGRPTSIALPHSPDWRWLLDRPDTPWYPTVRLFRQPAPGDWDAVGTALAAALRRAAPERGAPESGATERGAPET